MCFGLFIATGSFFLGQQQVVPAFLRGSIFLTVLALLPFPLMIYWLVRVRFMFTPEQRALVRSDLLEYAAHDQRISGAAITGSAASDGEDKWSDVDLAFGLADPADQPGVLSDWTSYIYEKHSALHHLDVRESPQ